MPKVGMQPIRQRQLIDATLATINEVGLHAATVAQIAKRAGLSSGIVSHYFGDKNGLLEATMRDITSKLRHAILDKLHSLDSTETEARLAAIVDANFDKTQVHPAVAKAWLDFWVSSLHHPTLHRLQRVSNRRLQSTIVTEFCRLLPRDQAKLAGFGLTALIDGLWLRAALTGEPFQPWLIKQVTNQFIHQQLVMTKTN